MNPRSPLPFGKALICFHNCMQILESKWNFPKLWNVSASLNWMNHPRRSTSDKCSASGTCRSWVQSVRLENDGLACVLFILCKPEQQEEVPSDRKSCAVSADPRFGRQELDTLVGAASLSGGGLPFSVYLPSPSCYHCSYCCIVSLQFLPHAHAPNTELVGSRW